MTAAVHRCVTREQFDAIHAEVQARKDTSLLDLTTFVCDRPGWYVRMALDAGVFVIDEDALAGARAIASEARISSVIEQLKESLLWLRDGAVGPYPRGPKWAP